jgi:hypothetical protein
MIVGDATMLVPVRILVAGGARVGGRQKAYPHSEELTDA